MLTMIESAVIPLETTVHQIKLAHVLFLVPGTLMHEITVIALKGEGLEGREEGKEGREGGRGGEEGERGREEEGR